MVSAEFSVWLDKNRLQLFDLYRKMETCWRPEYQKAFRDVSEALALNLLVENKPTLSRCFRRNYLIPFRYYLRKIEMDLKVQPMPIVAFFQN
jgi:hypothetical protein